MPPSLLLLLLSALVEQGPGTGWTVGKKCKLSLNPNRCGKLSSQNPFKGISFGYTSSIEYILLFFLLVYSTKLDYSLISTTDEFSVKMVLSAAFAQGRPSESGPWEKTCLQSHSKKISHQRLNVGPLFKEYKTKVLFNEWFVGVVDGDGTFSITQGKNSISSFQYSFKITQSIYNYRLLYYIKKQIGYGSITKYGETLIQYRIRDTKVLKDIIIPIFENYPLHTSKYYAYSLWKNALLNPEKRGPIIKQMREGLPISYNRMSPHNTIPTKSWIVGFIEAEGSFYLTKKDNTRVVHAFGITQKLDYHILEQLKKIFGIKAKIKKNKNNAFLLETTNSRNIQYLIDYLNNTQKGMKAVEYRIWARSFIKNKGNFTKLLFIERKLRMIS